MRGNISNEISILINKSKKVSSERPEDAFQISNKAYILAKEFNLKSEEGYSLIGMAYACRVMSKYSEGLKYTYDAYGIFEKIDDIEGQVRALNLIGIIYFYFGEYRQAIVKLVKALKLLKKKTHEFLQSCVLNNIGEVYREAGDFDKSLGNY